MLIEVAICDLKAQPSGKLGGCFAFWKEGENIEDKKGG